MSGVIREFLVSLGFCIDEQQMRRFQDGITGSTAAVSGLGRSALDTALQVVDAVEKMAKQYEGLHYASQRTHATVGNLKAIAYASSQVGMSAEEGAAAVEGFAQALRTPGKAEWLKSFGVTAKDAAEGFGQLMKSLKKTYGDGSIEKQNIAESIAGSAGINPGTFLQIWNNSDEFFKYFDAYNDSLKNAGVNTKKVSDESTDLMKSLRSLESHLDIAKVKMLEGLVKPTEEAVKWFDGLIVRLEKTGGFIDKITGKTPNGSEESWIDSLFSPFIRDEDRAEWSKGIKERNEKWRDPSRDPLKPNITTLPKSMLHQRTGGAASSANDLDVIAQIESGGRPNVQTGRYKGAFQLSDEEFQKYGGGNIWDASDNRRAASAKLTEQKAAFLRRHGRNPTLTELYLMHQQGEGGAEAHMAHPERAAWLNMLSTGEGRKKGSKWAQKAIWGNVPTDMRKRFPGGVTDVTSQDFMSMWGEKINRFSARLGVPQGGDMQMAPSAPDVAGGTSNAINQTNHFTVNAGGLDPDNAKKAVMAALRTATGYMYVELDRLR